MPAVGRGKGLEFIKGIAPRSRNPEFIGLFIERNCSTTKGLIGSMSESPCDKAVEVIINSSVLIPKIHERKAWRNRDPTIAKAT